MACRYFRLKAGVGCRYNTNGLSDYLPSRFGLIVDVADILL
jgi:hypothetical protein